MACSTGRMASLCRSGRGDRSVASSSAVSAAVSEEEISVSQEEIKRSGQAASRVVPGLVQRKHDAEILQRSISFILLETRLSALSCRSRLPASPEPHVAPGADRIVLHDSCAVNAGGGRPT